MSSKTKTGSKSKSMKPETAGSGDAFIREEEQVSGAKDDLAEHLAESYLKSALSGENDDEDTRDQVLEEELGGPFLEVSPEEEFGTTRFYDLEEGVEPSPLPAAVGSLAIAAPDELVQDDDTADEDLATADGEDSEEDPLALDAEPSSRVEPPIAAVVGAKVGPLH